jgi:hypothetical protein
MKEKQTIIIGAFVCVTLIVTGIFFWPTLYHYEKIIFDKDTLLVRVNRLSGYTEILFPFGWQEKIREKKTIVIPKDERGKVEIIGDFDGEGHYKFAVYNGTMWTIKIIRLSIETLSIKDKDIVHRIHEIPVNISPYSVKPSYSTMLINYTPKTFGGGEWVLEEDPKSTKSKLLSDGETALVSKFRPKVAIEEIFGYKD